jgi:hypothetical protein
MIQPNLGNVRRARCAAIRVLRKKSDGEIVRAAIAQALIFHIETLSHGRCLERPAFVSLL